MARQLNDGAGRFDELGMHAVAAGLDRAARELAAAAWVIWPPVREKGSPAGNGHRPLGS